MARAKFVTTSADRWTADLQVLGHLIAAQKPEGYERLLEVVATLQGWGEGFYKTFQKILRMLETAEDGLQLSPFAREVLKGQAIRVWMEPNPVNRQKIWDELTAASVPKPQSVPQGSRSRERAVLPGVEAERPEWTEPA